MRRTNAAEVNTHAVSPVFMINLPIKNIFLHCKDSQGISKIVPKEFY